LIRDTREREREREREEGKRNFFNDVESLIVLVNCVAVGVIIALIDKAIAIRYTS
jgi:hypothetical protein